MIREELEEKRRQLSAAQKTHDELKTQWVSYPEMDRPITLTRNLKAQDELIQSIQAEIDELEQQLSAEQTEVTAPEQRRSDEQPESLPPESTEKQAVNSKDVFAKLRFMNRRGELSLLSNPKGVSNYLVIDAPAEYGKTTLLNALMCQYQTSPNCWTCIYHKVSAFDTPYSLLNSISKKLLGDNEDIIEEGSSLDDGIGLLARKIIDYAPAKPVEDWGITVIFDNLEQLIACGAEPYHPIAGKTAVWMMETFVPNLMDQLQRSGFLNKHDFKFVFSGRYIANIVRGVSGHLPIAVVTLSPFDWNTVREAVENKSRELTYPPKESAVVQHTWQLMYHTGGHPGYLTHLLAEIANARFAPDPIKFYQDRIDGFYEAHIRKTIESIRKAVRNAGGSDGEQLVDALDTLSVFRRFDAAIIKELQQLGELKWTLSPWELIAKLGPLHMLTLDRGYYRDAIARRLLVIRLRQKELPRFKDVCKIASDLYKKRLDSEKRQKEPILIFTEWLYQEAQLAVVDQEKRDWLRSTLISGGIRSQILGVISNLDEYESPTERLSSLRSEIVSVDDELKFMLNFALKTEMENGDFNPISALTKTIDAIITESKPS